VRGALKGWGFFARRARPGTEVRAGEGHGRDGSRTLGAGTEVNC
jgi:hypothetical protein